MHRQIVHDIMKNFEVPGFLDDGFCSIVNGDDGGVQLVVGGAGEDGFQDRAGTCHAAFLATGAGILEAHAGGDIENQQQVLPFFWLHFFDDGAMGGWRQEK